MAQRSQSAVWTADELEAIPDDSNRYEVIDGVLHVTATPSKAHQYILGSLHMLLRPYAAALGITVYMAPLDVRVDALTQVEPDLLAVPREQDRAVATRWTPMPLLLLAVEILSPSTAHVDRGRKRELYMTERVDQYWIVDIEAQLVEVWRPDSADAVVLTAQDALSWQPVAGVSPLVIELAALFGELI